LGLGVVLGVGLGVDIGAGLGEGLAGLGVVVFSFPEIYIFIQLAVQVYPLPPHALKDRFPEADS
jgi:hypothetical protein